MLTHHLFPCWITLLLLTNTVDLVGQQTETDNPAVRPQPRLEEWWFERHAKKIGEFKKEKIDLLMIGDSITHNFESVGKQAWETSFAPLHAVNLGFGGDRTNHVLWRLEHLPPRETPPKAAVVMIGTNNICWGRDQPRQAAVGVQAVAQRLHQDYPEMNILVLGVFPRRRKADHPHRQQIVELNGYLPELLEEIPNVTFKDIGEQFLDENGFLSEKMMPDTTHPSAQGHQVWADAIKADLEQMLK